MKESAQNSRGEKLARVFLLFLVLGFFVVVISQLSDQGTSQSSTTTVSSASTQERTESWKQKDASLMAYHMLAEWVKERLKAPSTADFPGIFEGRADHIIHLGDQQYRIRSWVDSQNSFGAQIRTHFTGVVVQVRDGEWRLESLEFLQ